MKKFDFVIGNPPYQEETAIKNTKNGMKRSKSVFQEFQIEADKISNISVLIYPAVRWIHQGGKGMKKFGIKQINDIHLSKLIYYPSSKDVFPGVSITDGISIVVKNKLKNSPGFKYEFVSDGKRIRKNLENPGSNLLILHPDDIDIVKNIVMFVKINNLKYLHDSILPQKLFGIESSFVEDNPEKVRPLEDSTINQNTEIKLLANDKSGSAGRSKWYITDKNNIPKNEDYIYLWKVTVISANPGGQRRDNQLEIIDNKSAFGRSKVALKAFNTKVEAENFYKYMDSDIIRYSLLLTNEALSSVAKYTPDLINYTNNNKYIEFNKNIDLQLKKLLNLSDEQFLYIQQKIKDHRR